MPFTSQQKWFRRIGYIRMDLCVCCPKTAPTHLFAAVMAFCLRQETPARGLLHWFSFCVGDVCRQLAEFLIHLNLDWAFIVHYGPFFLCHLGRGMGGLWEGCRKGTVAPPNETCKLLGYKISNWQKSFTPPRRGYPERGYLEVPYSFRTCMNRPCPLLLQLQLGIPMQLL